MRLFDYLAGHRVSYDPLPHPPAFSAQRLAHYLHLRGSMVAKAVLLRGPEGFFVAILPATHRIDLTCLAIRMGGAVRVAQREEAARLFRDCEWGVVSPFGTLYGLPAFVDITLTPETLLVLNAWSHVEAMRLTGEELERLAGAERLSFARPAGIEQD